MAATMTDAQRRKTEAKIIAKEVGPRKVGGVYWSVYGGRYEVVKIETGSDGIHYWNCWRITVRCLDDGEIRTHCTAWDAKRDRIISQPQEAI